MVLVSSSGWKSQSSILYLSRFSSMLCMTATRRLCTVFGPRHPGKTPLACQSTQLSALAN